MPKTKGYVLYEGPSAINGESIAAILTLESTNKKTSLNDALREYNVAV